MTRGVTGHLDLVDCGVMRDPLPRDHKYEGVLRQIIQNPRDRNNSPKEKSKEPG
jgi:hypothetical protein